MCPHVSGLSTRAHANQFLEISYIRVQFGKVLLDHLGQILDFRCGITE